MRHPRPSRVVFRAAGVDAIGDPAMVRAVPAIGDAQKRVALGLKVAVQQQLVGRLGVGAPAAEDRVLPAVTEPPVISKWGWRRYS